MITLVNISPRTNVLQLRGLSTDTKPIDTWVDTSVKPNITRRVVNGSIFIEIDQKGKTYRYDKENKKWEEQASGGGGGDDPGEMATTEEVLNAVDSIDWG